MFTAKVSFSKAGENLEAMAERVIELLAAWDKNGQIIGNSWPIADIGGALEAFVQLPAVDSLGAVHNNVWATRAVEALLPASYSVTVLGRDPCRVGLCACPSRSAFVLFTHFLANGLPPVRCLDCFDPVALYTLPHPEGEEYLELLQWAADYSACDTLQMLSTTGERFGEQQLWRHDSSLSRHGRSLCSQLELLTGVPVYYYLHKCRSRSRASELQRRCPSCGSEWRLDPRLHLFDFQCRKCRLLSAIARDVA
ncbi:MAG: Zn-ribbon-containing protein [Verrucomicrobiales bacterium]|nr:Zn-ribbon-containing protein [Verrucomicrobiales bacterium]